MACGPWESVGTADAEPGDCLTTRDERHFQVVACTNEKAIWRVLGRYTDSMSAPDICNDSPGNTSYVPGGHNDDNLCLVEWHSK